LNGVRRGVVMKRPKQAEDFSLKATTAVAGGREKVKTVIAGKG